MNACDRLGHPYLNVKCLDAGLAPVAAAAVADAPAQSAGFAADSRPHLAIDSSVGATTRAAHARRAVNDSEYASTDEFAGATVHARHWYSDEVEIGFDRTRSMICDSDSDDSVDLTFAIVVASRASNDSVWERLSCAVDTTHSDPFAHDRSPHAVPVDPADVGSSHLDRSRRTIGGLVAPAVHPDTWDALHFASNAVAVIVAVSAAFAVDSNCRMLVAASSCLVVMGIASFADLVAGKGTCVGDMRPQRPPIAVFAIDVELVEPFAGAHSPLRPPMDTVMLAHYSALPSHPNRPDHLIRQHADRPCRTYCRQAIDTLGIAIAAEIAVAVDVGLDGVHRHRAVPLDAPQLQSHHIDSMHLCVSKMQKL